MIVFDSEKRKPLSQVIIMLGGNPVPTPAQKPKITIIKKKDIED
jgi:hypothetical protein